MEYAATFKATTVSKSATVNTTDAEFKNICPDWEPGVRLWLAIPDICCDWGISGSWTYIDSDDSSTVKAPSGGEVVSPLLHGGLVEIAGLFKKAKGEWEACYHEWDVLFSYDLCCNECHSFTPFFGAAGIVLDQDLKVKLTNPGGEHDGDEGSVKWESDYWGVGLRFGSKYEYVICDCLRLFARASATLLAGEEDAKTKQFVIDCGYSNTKTVVKIDDDDCCHFVPGYHIGTGLVYDTCICNFDFSVRVGYEFVNWHNFPKPRVFAGDDVSKDVSHSTSASTRNFGFHGLLAGFSICF